MAGPDANNNASTPPPFWFHGACFTSLNSLVSRDAQDDEKEAERSCAAREAVYHDHDTGTQEQVCEVFDA